MKTLEIEKATGSLAQYAKSVHKEPVIVTRLGRPFAALMPVENTDVETATLSTHPKFLALIERARVRHQKQGGISSRDLRRRLGLKPAPSRRRSKR
jgi:antitoxin (DNA-binding transcriptional repressor) of toxin-antitoxin stability system